MSFFITDLRNIIKGVVNIGKISVYERNTSEKLHEQKIVISDPRSLCSNRSAVVVMVPFQDGGIVKGFIGAVILGGIKK